MIDGADGLEEIEAATARHLLIQQHDAVGLPLKEHQGIVTMGAGLYREALFFEKQDV
jgi:hypothetical protein